MFSNGGFPPIKYKNNLVIKKERYFNPSIKRNINIYQLLEEKKVKPIIEIKNDDDLEITDNI